MPAEPSERDVIRILGLEDPEDRASFRRPAEWRVGWVDLPVGEFRERVAAFLDGLGAVFAGLPEPSGDFRLDQVTVNAEISAKGRLSLLGSGGEVGGRAGLAFTFTRRGAAAHPPGGAGDDGVLG